MVSIPAYFSLCIILYFAHVLGVCVLEIMLSFVLTLILFYCLVDTLLSSGTKVVLYSGQLDLIVDTMGK